MESVGVGMRAENGEMGRQVKEKKKMGTRQERQDIIGKRLKCANACLLCSCLKSLCVFVCEAVFEITNELFSCTFRELPKYGETLCLL